MGELAAEAGVTLSAASVHLAKLESSRIVVSRKQGRSRHFRIADPDVAHCVEALVTVAARAGHLRARPGPREEAMRHARSCYDHLAGQIAVHLFERWVAAGVLRWRGEEVCLTGEGATIPHRPRHRDRRTRAQQTSALPDLRRLERAKASSRRRHRSGRSGAGAGKELGGSRAALTRRHLQRARREEIHRVVFIGIGFSAPSHAASPPAFSWRETE
jgi:DNA-binding transcriptional ArsR family regulator